jgi:hypothetical protein
MKESLVIRTFACTAVVIAFLSILLPLVSRGQTGDPKQATKQNPPVQPKREAKQSPDRLKEVVRASSQAHSESCNEFLTSALNQYLKEGETLAEEGKALYLYSNVDLSGMNANKQLGYMKKHWIKVDVYQATRMADEGKLIVAGMQGQTGHHGHVAVVMPGGPDPTTGWPIVAGGGTIAARSIEGKSLNNVWRREFLQPKLQVEFFTPRFIRKDAAVGDKPPSSSQPEKKQGRKTIGFDDNAPKR